MRDLYLMHYGTPRHSGRYPWGSGKDPYQRDDFMTSYKKMHANGYSDKEIADMMGITTTILRQRKSEASDNERIQKIERAKSLREAGNSYTAIAEIMGTNESNVRNWIKSDELAKAQATSNTANFLKDQLKEKRYLDVGSGVEADLNISKTKLNTALNSLKEEGYEVYSIKVPQATNKNQYTTIKVLAPPGKTWADVMKNQIDISTVTDYSEDGGKTVRKLERPTSIDSSRIQIRYAEDGGTAKDGVIELRRGVEDISLGDASYAQVRIAVDGTHYLKGMAMYSDDLPAGVDILFNTNKHEGTPMCGDDSKNTVLKKMKDDPDNPFGAAIKASGQRWYTDSDGKEKLSPINKLREEGDWDSYSRNLSSQFLSKQNLSLINKQLNLSYADKEAEFNDICSLTNAAVKKRLLQSFADDCDATAVDLKAAALPGQASKVILPLTCIKDTEVYAPTFKNGSRVCLIRYPHGGTFEIPELVVNNTNKKAKDILGNAKDAIGINSNVAAKLSGADFDGDTVVVIPLSEKVKITTSPSLKGLEGFEPKEAYPYREGMKVMKKSQTGTEMGKISNLITDMTLKGATADELARAVRHSMVVIDAEKHKLDYKKSEEDNQIDALKKKYQKKANGGYGGSSTLISRAKAEYRVDERKMFTYSSKSINPQTGEKIFAETGRTYEKNGKTHKYQTESTQMAEAKDARSLISATGSKKEEAYAAYANRMKALANKARKEYLSVKSSERNPQAAKTYANEVASLKAKLNNAVKNSPKERQAQLYANNVLYQKKRENPNMTSEDKKKAAQQALANGRVKYGANKRDVEIDISPREWEAIQAGAVSTSIQIDIFKYTNLDKIRELATPRNDGNTTPPAVQGKIRSMEAAGYSISEIAEACGISSSTVSKYI